MNWYCSPLGMPSGDGSIANPWDLYTGINQKSAVVHPGDTIFLRGGRYVYAKPWQFTFVLTGTAAAPILVASAPGEWAILDVQANGTSLVLDNPKRMLNATIAVGRGAAYVVLAELEITASGIPRTTSNPGSFGIGSIQDIEIHGEGCELVNCYIHDMHAGPGFWHEATGAKISGCIIGNVGWNAPDRGHGHCIYAQNEAAGIKKLILDNILYSSFDIGMQWYGSGAAVIEDIEADGNILINSGAPIGQAVGQLVIAGGGASKRRLAIRNGIDYISPQLSGGFSQIGWGWDGDNVDVEVTGNYFTRDTEFWHWQKLLLHNNYFEGRAEIATNDATGETLAGVDAAGNQYNPDAQLIMGSSHLDSAGTIVSNISAMSVAGWEAAAHEPDGKFGVLSLERVTVRPNPNRLGRANIAILNPASKPTMPVDLSLVGGLKDGDKWELRDALNFRAAPVMSGAYSAASPVIQVPMAARATAPIDGYSLTMPHTLPLMGAFVFLGGGAFDGSGAFVVPPAPPPAPLPPPPPAALPVPANPASGSPPVVVFQVSKAAIAVGEFSFLEWSVAFAADAQAGGQSVTISSLPGNQPRAGVKAVAPNVSTLYLLTATDSKGLKTTATVTVTIGGVIPPPIPVPPPVPVVPPSLVVDFTALPMALSAPGSTVLTWSVQGAATVELIGFGMQPASKTLPRALTADTTFTLKATDAAGQSISKVLTVTVGATAPPTPTPVAIDAATAAFIQNLENTKATGTASIPFVAGKESAGTFAAPAPASMFAFVMADALTKGNWKGVYGGAGQMLAPGTYSNLKWAAPFTWADPSNDSRALNNRAACWFSSGAFTVDVNFTDGKSYRVALYFVDFDYGGRAQIVEVLDDSGKVLDTQRLSAFAGGVWLVWNVSGHVTFRITKTAGENAVLSGVFFS
jgi:hypothetical protein